MAMQCINTMVMHFNYHKYGDDNNGDDTDDDD